MVMLFSFPMSIKKNMGKKTVVLSAMHSSVRVTKDKRKKPQVHSFMITQKGELVWLILHLLINLHASNLPAG